MFRLIYRKGIVKQWIITCLAVMAICISAAAVALVISYKTVTSESTRANLAIMNNLRLSVDYQLKSVMDVASRFSHDSSIVTMTSTTNFLPQNRRQFLQRLINETTSIATTNNSIDSIYIYLNNCDRVIGDKGYVTEEIYLMDLYKQIDVSYEDWKEITSGYYKGSFLAFNALSGGKKAFYISSIQFSQINGRYSNIIISIDDHFFRDIVNNNVLPNGGNITILDDNGDIYLFSGNDTLYEYVSQNVNAFTYADDAVAYEDIQNERYAVTSLSSVSSGWHYLSFIPIATFSSSLVRLRYIFAVVTLLCLVVSFALILVFSFGNYSSVSSLMSLLSKDGKQKNVGNEFHYIHNLMSAKLYEIERVKKELTDKHSVLKNNYLCKLITGELSKGDDDGTVYELGFDGEHFAIIYTEPIYKAESNDMFILENILSELLSKHFTTHSVRLNSKLFFIINWNSPINHQYHLRELHNYANLFIDSHFKLGMMLSVSSVVNSTDSLNIAYIQAIEAMEYNITSEKENIVFYENTQFSDIYYNYPLQVEQSLINNLMTGDAAAAREIVGNVLNSNKTGENVSPLTIKCLNYDFICTLLKVMLEINTRHEAEATGGSDAGMRESAWSEEREINIVKDIASCRHISELSGKLSDIIDIICAKTFASKKSRNTSLKDAITDYVSEHYKEYECGIASIAAHFEMNSAYISRFYKEQTNISLLDLINMKRIQAAKELLNDQHKTLLDIARETGFVNNIALIRTFKKYEGLTPRKYKPAD